MSDDEPAGRDDRAREEAERLDEQAAWDAIVAGYGDRVLDDPEAGQPPADAPGTGGGSDRSDDPLTIFDRPAYDARSAWRSDPGAGPGREPPAEHEESSDRYVPPEPPPLPRPRGARGFAWVGVFGVPFLYLVLTLLDIRLVSGAGLLLLLWFVAGFGYLIGTMREEPGDGWDDGARV